VNLSMILFHPNLDSRGHRERLKIDVFCPCGWQVVDSRLRLDITTEGSWMHCPLCGTCEDDFIEHKISSSDAATAQAE
jgi:hypothetical protein